MGSFDDFLRIYNFSYNKFSNIQYNYLYNVYKELLNQYYSFLKQYGCNFSEKKDVEIYKFNTNSTASIRFLDDLSKKRILPSEYSDGLLLSNDNKIEFNDNNKNILELPSNIVCANPLDKDNIENFVNVSNLFKGNTILTYFGLISDDNYDHVMKNAEFYKSLLGNNNIVDILYNDVDLSQNDNSLDGNTAYYRLIIVMK